MKIDLFEQCTQYQVQLDKLSTEQLNELEVQYGADLEDEYMYLFGDELAEYEVPDEAVVWGSGEFNEKMFEDLLDTFLDDYPYYLVFASGVRWNGASGYMFTNDKVKTLYRDYDASVYVQKYNGKTLIVTESSHDVPMGSNTYIVGITDRQKDLFEDAEFSEIEEFVRKSCGQ